MSQMSKMSQMSQSMLKDVIARLSSKYNFDASEAYEMIGVSKVVVKNVVVKSAFPMPYSGELNCKCCLGMRQNNGLYTQCEKLRPEDKGYCSMCETQAMKNEHGLPDYGNIQTRLSAYQINEEFKDPSGKSPVAYIKIMNKFKVTKEQVLEEAGKLGLAIDPRHFEEVAKKCGRPKESKKEKMVSTEVKSKGRPKKSKKVLELSGEEDLFASLVMSVNSQVIVREVVSEVVGELEKEIEVEVEKEIEKEIEVEVVSEVVSEVVVKAKPTKKAKVSTDENKEAKEQEKLGKELAKLQEKADKEKEKAFKVILAEQQKVEKMIQAAQKKQELEEQKAAKLVLLEQKKSELAQQKKEKKVAPKVASVAVASVAVASVAVVKEVVEDEADVVKKINFEGKKYLKSKNSGIIYNMDQDVIGKWNEEKQRIDFNEQDEESEDEYDEDE